MISDAMRLAFDPALDWALIGLAGASAVAGAAAIAPLIAPRLGEVLRSKAIANTLSDTIALSHITNDTIWTDRGIPMRIYTVAARESVMREEYDRQEATLSKEAFLLELGFLAGIELRVVTEIVAETYTPTPSAHYPNKVVEIADTRAQELSSYGYRPMVRIYLWASNKKLETLEAAEKILMRGLATLSPRRLSQADGDALQPATILRREFDPFATDVLTGDRHDLASDLATADLAIGLSPSNPAAKGLWRYTRAGKVTYVGVASVSQLPNQLREHFSVEISRLAIPMIIAHRLTPFAGGSRMVGTGLLESKKRLSAAQIQGGEESKAAWSRLMEGYTPVEGAVPVSLFDHSVTLFVRGDTPEDVHANITAVEDMCAQSQVKLTTCVDTAEGAFAAQWPGFNRGPLRPFLLTNIQSAALISLDSPESGEIRCDWGEGALLRIRTMGRAWYNLQLHSGPPNRDGEGVVAHAGLIGRSGVGKTTFEVLMIRGMLRWPKTRCLAIDAERSLLIATETSGGRYFALSEGARVFNPFDAPASPELIGFLTGWILMLAAGDPKDGQLTLEASNAITQMMALPTEIRSLDLMCDPEAGFLDATRPGGLWERLRTFVDPETPRGRLFNAPKNPIDLNCPWVTFDLTSVFSSDPLAAAAVVAYLAFLTSEDWRIKGYRGMQLIEEAPTIFGASPEMRAFFAKQARTMRRRGVAMVTAWQEYKAIVDLGLESVVRENMPTLFLWPGGRPDPQLAAAFNLSDRSRDFLANGWSMPRGVLMQRYTPTTGDRQTILNLNIQELAETPEGNLFRLSAGSEDAIWRWTRAKQRAGLDDPPTQPRELESAVSHYLDPTWSPTS